MKKELLTVKELAEELALKWRIVRFIQGLGFAKVSPFILCEQGLEVRRTALVRQLRMCTPSTGWRGRTVPDQKTNEGDRRVHFLASAAIHSEHCAHFMRAVSGWNSFGIRLALK
jgi:hypothetical protein